jgi:hypothetical protein
MGMWRATAVIDSSIVHLRSAAIVDLPAAPRFRGE